MLFTALTWFVPALILRHDHRAEVLNSAAEMAVFTALPIGYATAFAIAGYVIYRTGRWILARASK